MLSVTANKVVKDNQGNRSHFQGEDSAALQAEFLSKGGKITRGRTAIAKPHQQAAGFFHCDIAKKGK